EPAGHEAPHPAHDAAHDAPALPRDLNAREIGLLLPLAALCVVLGLYPTPVLRALEAPAEQTIQMVRGPWRLPVGHGAELASSDRRPSTDVDGPDGHAREGAR